MDELVFFIRRKIHSLDKTNFKKIFYKISTFLIRFQGWQLKIMKKRKILGKTDYKEKIFELSSYAVKYYSLKEFKDLFIHEIAHILLPDHGHDIEWKLLCIRLGGNPKEHVRPIYLKKFICSHCKNVRYSIAYTQPKLCCNELEKEFIQIRG